MKKLIAKLGTTAMLMLPFAIAAFVVLEVLVRRQGAQSVPHPQPCVISDELTHHRYQPDCSFTQATDFGPVRYHFNGDGLREREREEFSGANALVVLGDSIVKGLFLNAPDTLSSRLETAEGETRKFINAGVRFTGPTSQAAIFLRDILPNYPVKGVIWLLNEGDAADERLLRSEAVELDETQTPLRFLLNDKDPYGGDAFSDFLDSVPISGQGMRYLVRAWKFHVFSQRLKSVPASKEVLCGGIFRLANALKEKKIPILLVISPHYEEGIRRNWMGEPFQPSDTDQMLACGREAGIATLDLRTEKLKKEWYFEDHMHFRPEGIRWLAGRLRELGLNKNFGAPRRDKSHAKPEKNPYFLPSAK